MTCPVCHYAAPTFGWAEHHRRKMPYSCQSWLSKTCPHQWQRVDSGKVCVRCRKWAGNGHGLEPEGYELMADIRDDAGRIPSRNHRHKAYPKGPTGKNKKKEAGDGVAEQRSAEATGVPVVEARDAGEIVLEETRCTAEGDAQA